MLKRAIRMDNLPYELYKVLSRPERVLTVSIPVRMDDGRLEVLEGYRVQYSSALGPYKGGIRFHPEVDLETDMALALGMTLKNALNNLPYGGGKGAVKVDPKRLSRGAGEAEQGLRQGRCSLEYSTIATASVDSAPMGTSSAAPLSSH